VLWLAVIHPAPAARGSQSAQPKLPLRAAFYYPWYPQTWTVGGQHPHDMPSLGYYNSTSTALIRRHIRAMRWARIKAGIASWWGHGSLTDTRLRRLLRVTAQLHSPFRWSLYYEAEAQGNPTVGQLRADLTYLRDRYANQPAFLRLNGRFVVFVYADGGDACGMADRWKQANTVGAYVVLKVFPGYQGCASQPGGWHQYAPVGASNSQGRYSYSISPGFWKADEGGPRLARNLARWTHDVRRMVASRARFQLVTTFNEWGEGTAAESARQWATRSGYGAYLDALHANGRLRAAAQRKEAAARQTPRGTAVLLAAGDIAECGNKDDDATARLVAARSGTVAPLGDLAYEDGTTADFACYNASWGRFKSRTRPAPGNHDYNSGSAQAYFTYFGAAAGPGTRGYYSYNLGRWHIVSLNSNCGKTGGCDAGSPQDRWLRRDLARSKRLCTLAYWHHPRFSSGQHGSDEDMKRFWDDLYRDGAEIVLVGHDHDYERFAPQTPSGVLSPARGIREFVVGTGGKNHYRVGAPIVNSRVRNDKTFGILKLTLKPRGYAWRFIPEAGKTFTDAGSSGCH
jgi:calcineurin-like phosphoesterase family protein/glycosyl hydrolase family 99